MNVEAFVFTFFFFSKKSFTSVSLHSCPNYAWEIKKKFWATVTGSHFIVLPLPLSVFTPTRSLHLSARRGDLPFCHRLIHCYLKITAFQLASLECAASDALPEGKAEWLIRLLLNDGATQQNAPRASRVDFPVAAVNSGVTARLMGDVCLKTSCFQVNFFWVGGYLSSFQGSLILLVCHGNCIMSAEVWKTTFVFSLTCSSLC